MRRPAAAAADLAVVAAFVLLGRRSHDSDGGLAAALGTAWPFVAAALAAHVVLAAGGRRPDSLPSGAVVAASAVLGGSALRVAVQQDGAPPSFVAVTAAVLATGALGWRAALARRRPSGTTR